MYRKDNFLNEITSADRLQKMRDIASDELRLIEKELEDMRNWIKEINTRIQELNKKQ